MIESFICDFMMIHLLRRAIERLCTTALRDKHRASYSARENLETRSRRYKSQNKNKRRRWNDPNSKKERDKKTREEALRAPQ